MPAVLLPVHMQRAVAQLCSCNTEVPLQLPDGDAQATSKTAPCEQAPKRFQCCIAWRQMGRCMLPGSNRDRQDASLLQLRIVQDGEKCRQTTALSTQRSSTPQAGRVQGFLTRAASAAAR